MYTVGVVAFLISMQNYSIQDGSKNQSLLMFVCFRCCFIDAFLIRINFAGMLFELSVARILIWEEAPRFPSSNAAQPPPRVGASRGESTPFIILSTLLDFQLQPRILLSPGGKKLFWLFVGLFFASILIKKRKQFKWRCKLCTYFLRYRRENLLLDFHCILKFEWFHWFCAFVVAM